ncbi:MAG TPA: hypothetical protein V6D35_21785 [Candidatus Sericytochromatia bacterium]
MNMMPLCDPFPYIGGLVGDQSWNFWHTRFSTSVDKNTELQPKKHKAWDVKKKVGARSIGVYRGGDRFS